jgi:hypothetical protein
MPAIQTALSALYAIFAVAVIAASIVAWRTLVNRNVVQGTNDALDLAQKERDLMQGQIKRLREDIEAMRGVVDLTDKRQYRTELALQRKERLELSRLQEIEYLEEVIHLMLPALAKSAPDVKKDVDAKLQALSQYRLRVHREQIEWEERKDALAVYLAPVSTGARDFMREETT